MRIRKHPLTPLAAVAAGLLAGAVGTGGLDAVHYLKYRREGGTEGRLKAKVVRDDVYIRVVEGAGDDAVQVSDFLWA